MNKLNPQEAVEPSGVASQAILLMLIGPQGLHFVFGIMRSPSSLSLVIDRTTLYWGLLTIMVLAVLFSSFLLR